MANPEVLLQLLVIGLANGAAIALNAIGVTLVFSVVRIINFAHGDVFALTTVLVVTVITRVGIHAVRPGYGDSPLLLAGQLLLALAAASLFGGALNLVVERTAFRPFRPRPGPAGSGEGGASSRLAPLVASLGLSFILYQAALIWRVFEPNFIPQEHRSVPGLPEVPSGGIPELFPNVDLLRAAGLHTGTNFTLKELLLLLLAAGCAAGASWLLRHTRLGRAIRAAAQNPELAQLCGINLDGTIARTFALGGAVAGAAAFVFTLYYTHPFGQHGIESGLLAFAAAILGGIGRPSGAFVSGLVLGVFAAFSDYFLAAQWTPVLIQVLLVALLVLRPAGLTTGAMEGTGGVMGGNPAGTTTRDALATIDRGWSTARRRLAGGLLLLALAYPLLDRALGLQRQALATTMAIFALLALGLNLLLGSAGLLDLGYAASFGIGGYTAALLVEPGGPIAARLPQPLDVLVVLAAGGAVASVFGLFNGALSLRLRSDYLAIVTLALGQIVSHLVLNLRWTGGSGGLSALPAPHLLTHALASPAERYYLALVPLLFITAVVLRLLRSRLGRAWLAAGDDELAAASCGIDLRRSKTLAFVLATSSAGIAGALYASAFSFIDPEEIGFRISAMVLAMVIVGGAGSVTGALLGAALITAYDRLIIPLLGALFDPRAGSHLGGGFIPIDIRGLSYLSFGLVLYLTVLLRAWWPRRPTFAVTWRLHR